MEYELYQGEDGIVMELASLRGIAGLMDEFGAYGNDEKATLFSGLGVALCSIAHRLECHTEQAEWPERDEAGVNEKRGTSGIWVMRELRQMGLTGREDIEMAMLKLGGHIQREKAEAEAERKRPSEEDPPKKGRKAAD